MPEHTDTERLDWLKGQSNYKTGPIEGGGWYFEYRPGTRVFGDDLPDAIDAAMREERDESV